MNNYPLVALGSILKRVERFEVRDDLKEYHFAGTYSFARGIFVGQRKLGATFKLPKVQRIHAGDFVYCKIMAWEGAFGVVPEEAHGCVLSGAFIVYEIDQTKIDKNYLAYYFKVSSVWKFIGKQSTGTNVRRQSLHPSQFEKAKISLPPLSEQQQIVARIEELAAKIEEARGLRNRSSDEVELLLAAGLRETRKQLLKSEFNKHPIGRLTQVTSGGTPSREISDYWNGDIPWVKTGELLDGDIYCAEENITEEGVKNSSAKPFPRDTVLIALYGQGQTRGRTGRLMIEAATNQACCAILPTPKLLEPRFTQYWLRSLYHEMREQNRAGAQPNWNGQMIKNIEIALPSIPEQRRIIAYLDNLQAKVDTLKQLQSETATELDALLPSILDKAFKGELY